VAERARHYVDVLLRIYAKRIVGEHGIAKRKIRSRDADGPNRRPSWKPAKTLRTTGDADRFGRVFSTSGRIPAPLTAHDRIPQNRTKYP
jgi:hypothetical protein